MEIKSIAGDVLFALEGAKTVLELVTAAIATKKSLGGANLRSAYLGGANLGGANLRSAYLGGAYLGGANLDGANLRSAYLGGAYLRGAYLDGAYLRGAYLDGAYLDGAYLDGKKIQSMRAFAGLYRYEVWAVVFEDGSAWVRMGCLFKSLEEWDTIGIRKSNLSEYPDDGSAESVERERAFEFAKAAALDLQKAGRK